MQNAKCKMQNAKYRMQIEAQIKPPSKREGDHEVEEGVFSKI